MASRIGSSVLLLSLPALTLAFGGLSAAPKNITVHLVPHTHDDTGWQVTVDQYFEQEVFYVVDTVAQMLEEDPNRKFIYVETAFFARWWDNASDEKRAKMKTLVKNGQLEFINGGWRGAASVPER